MTEEQILYTFQAVRRAESGELLARPIRQLSEQEFEETRTAIYRLENYLTGFDAYIWRALEDLRATAEKARTQFAEKGSSFSPGPVVSELELRIINVCAVVKMYAEHVIVRLGEMYGKESTERGDVKALFSQLYDSSLPYRVSNHLRNALVHGSPAELMQTTLHTSLPESGQPVTTVEVRLSRDGFRKHAQNAKVRDEVVALSEELELIATVTDTATGTMALHEDIMHLLSPGVVCPR
ncbi:hypothetical protein [Arthrobacter sp. Leaf69]|uniref:hypothetical protein n=1 Tax=Arthrobacter sp. Leaf69 TaxID=1736232 RepID=UPI0012E0F594|nr:hypothetical protein [Arthrobacter sp. Leaf69]